MSKKHKKTGKNIKKPAKIWENYQKCRKNGKKTSK